MDTTRKITIIKIHLRDETAIDTYKVMYRKIMKQLHVFMTL